MESPGYVCEPISKEFYFFLRCDQLQVHQHLAISNYIYNNILAMHFLAQRVIILV